MPIHEVESQIFQTLLEAGRGATLGLFIGPQGDGDVSQEHQLPDGKTLQRSQEPHTRPCVSIFGEFEIGRYVYAQREGQQIEFAAVDARLALPESKFSYLLQVWDQETICQYFQKNGQRMRYDEYLAAGYPIASGVIEGACRHVVKDRMERTGMNWVVPGAQAMLDLRCIFLCDKWDEFIAYRIAKETERLYPYRKALEPMACSLAA